MKTTVAVLFGGRSPEHDVSVVSALQAMEALDRARAYAEGEAGALDRVRNGMMILLDGQSGNVLLDPTPEELDAAKTRVSRRQRFDSRTSWARPALVSV